MCFEPSSMRIKRTTPEQQTLGGISNMCVSDGGNYTACVFTCIINIYDFLSSVYWGRGGGICQLDGNYIVCVLQVFGEGWLTSNVIQFVCIFEIWLFATIRNIQIIAIYYNLIVVNSQNVQIIVQRQIHAIVN